MNAAVVIRIAKLIALFGFFLPWVLFSCSGQEVGTMSGLDIARGHLEVTVYGQVQTQNVGINFLVLSALIVTVVGLIIAFTAKDKDGLRGAAVAAVVALAASFFGVMWLKDSPRREAAQQSRSSQASSFEAQIGAASLSAIRIQEQTGYWVTLIALAGAAGVGFLAQSPGGLPAVLGDTPVFGRRPEDDEVAYWDNVDKQDPLALREYLLRFPLGRFAELARMKLEQLGGSSETARSAEPQVASPVPVPSDGPATRVSQTATSSAYAYDAEPQAPTREAPSPLIWITGALVAMAAAALIFIPDVRNLALNTFTPAADDAAFLDQAGFNAPLQINVQLNQLYDREGQFVRNNNPALISLLLDGGFVSIQPYTEAAPWWRFSTANGSVENGRFTTTVARRVVASRSDQRRWSENGANYFSETVSYNVEILDAFRTIPQRTIGPFSLRLVAVDDPRVGEWRIQSRDYLGSSGSGNNDEAEQVLEAAVAAGRPNIGRITERVLAAQQEAYAQIEQNLIASNRIARGDAPNTVVIPDAGLVFWSDGNTISALSPRGAIAHCASAQVGSYTGWRLPSRQEFAAALDGDVFRDTPDRRFWGAIAAPPSGRSDIKFFVNELRGQPQRRGAFGRSWSQQTVAYTFETAESPLYSPTVTTFDLSESGRITASIAGFNTSGLSGVDTAVVLNRSVSFQGGARIICVANLSQASRAPTADELSAARRRGQEAARAASDQN